MANTLTVSSKSLFPIDSLKTAAVLKMISTLFVNLLSSLSPYPSCLTHCFCRVRPRCPASIQYYDEKMAHHTFHGNLIGFCLFNSLSDSIFDII